MANATGVALTIFKFSQTGLDPGPLEIPSPSYTVTKVRPTVLITFHLRKHKKKLAVLFV